MAKTELVPCGGSLPGLHIACEQGPRCSISSSRRSTHQVAQLSAILQPVPAPPLKYNPHMSARRRPSSTRLALLRPGAIARIALGPLPAGSRLDRVAAGAAGGVFVLASIGLPVTVANLTTSKTVPAWVVVLCIVPGTVGLALVTRSAQRPQRTPAARSGVPLDQQPSHHGSTNEPPTSDRACNKQRQPGIDVRDSRLLKSGIDIPNNAVAFITHSELNESPLTIRHIGPAPPRDPGLNE